MTKFGIREIMPNDYMLKQYPYLKEFNHIYDFEEINYITPYSYIEKRKQDEIKILPLEIANTITIPKPTTNNNYTMVDNIIKKIKLTKPEIETLDYYMAGLKFIQISKFLNINPSQIWKRIKSIQNKYIRYMSI